MADRRIPPYDSSDLFISRQNRKQRSPGDYGYKPPRRPRPGPNTGTARQPGPRARRPLPRDLRNRPGVPKPGIRSLKGRSKSVDKGTEELLKMFKKRKNMPLIRVRKDARFIVYVNQFKDIFSWQIIVSLLIVLIGGLGSLAIHAHVTYVENQINMSRRRLQQAQIDVFTLQSRLEERYTDAEIEWIAIDRLGMNFPEPAQIIEINVPRQGGATLNTVKRDVPVENYIANEIRYFITGVLNRIFGGGA